MVTMMEDNGVMSGEATKRCSACGETLPVSSYRKHKRNGDGLESRCTPCIRKADRERNARNKARNAEGGPRMDGVRYCGGCSTEKAITDFGVDSSTTEGRAYRCRDCEAERMSRYYAENPEYFRDYYERNRHVKWRNDTASRARKLGLEPHSEHFTREDVEALWGSRCFYCGEDNGEPLELDHFWPFSKFPVHTLANARLAHKRCNVSKHNQNPYEYMRKLPEFQGLTTEEYDRLVASLGDDPDGVERFQVLPE